MNTNSIRRHVNMALFGILAAAATGCLAEAGDEAGIEEEAFGEAASEASTVYRVGPSRSYKSLQAVSGLLRPGDVVEVDGDATYAGGVRFLAKGSPSAKITIRGVRVNGRRPVISGSTNTVEFGANHYVFEGFDVTAGSTRCVFHRGHDITIRDTVVHDCPGHGILGADSGSGSLTLEYVEVHSSGSGTTRHPVYIATDESAYPGSVFRMRHSYVHHGKGGNNVKTRAERNEIHYNWIEGAVYKELELIGPDGQDPDLAREDSDVVGNVFLKTGSQFAVRIGGDGTGDTNGRYRFLNNTFVLAPSSSSVIHVFDGVESLEMHNNVFYRQGGGAVSILRDDGSWASGKQVAHGSNNFVPPGSSYPGAWKSTILGSDPGFVDAAARDFRLRAGSALVDAGLSAPPSPSGYAFPSPLTAAAYLPPAGKVLALGTASPRPASGPVDIGAFELATAGSTEPTIAPGEPTMGTVPAPSPVCRTAGVDEWKSAPLGSAEAGVFSASFDVTPSKAYIDGAVALSLGARSAWTGLAAIVRFGPSGRIDVRNGWGYGADAYVPYAAGTTYRIRFSVDVASKRYSVHVRPEGGLEVLLASGHAFRGEQQGVSSLDTWVTTQVAASGSLEACLVSAP